MQPSSLVQAFNPYGLNKQEIAYFNRAVGHAYKAAVARARWIGGRREAMAETAAENSDINIVGTLLHRRGINVTFKDIFAHVNGRGIALHQGHRSYSYGGYSYASPPLAYYTNPIPGYNYSYWGANDAFFAGVFGALAFNAIENAYMQDQVISLQQDGFFNDWNSGGYTEIINTYPEPVELEGGFAGYDDPGFMGADVVSTGWGGGGDFVTQGDAMATGVDGGFGDATITEGTAGGWGGGGSFTDSGTDPAGGFAGGTSGGDFADDQSGAGTGGNPGGWGGGAGDFADPPGGGGGGTTDPGGWGGGGTVADPDPVDNSGGGGGGGGWGSGGGDFGGGNDDSGSGGGSDNNSDF